MTNGEYDGAVDAVMSLLACCSPLQSCPASSWIYRLDTDLVIGDAEQQTAENSCPLPRQAWVVSGEPDLPASSAPSFCCGLWTVEEGAD